MPSSNFQKVPSFERLRNLNTSVTFNGNLVPLATFKKNKVFFEKRICFSSKTQNFNGWRNFSIPVALCGIFATFGDCKKIEYFFSKNPSVFQKKPNPERFEKFNYFSRIIRQICYL